MTDVHTRHILLIDDDAVFNLVNKKIASKTYPCEVTSYTRASEALDQLRQWANKPDRLPDIIFLDINMPEMDGWEFLDAFQNLPADARAQMVVVMLTSSIDPEDIEKSKRYPSVRDFISKPLTIEKLLSLDGLSAGS